MHEKLHGIDMASKCHQDILSACTITQNTHRWVARPLYNSCTVQRTVQRMCSVCWVCSWVC
jgi:hypothetical protein